MERRQRLLICFLFVFCVWPCLSLRAQVTDNAAAFHVFPAIADGQPSEGISFRSTLMVTNPSDSTSVTCTFRLYGLRTTFSGGHIIRIATDSFRITLARNDWDIAISQGTGAFASGYGSLSCDRPVTAQILYSLYVNSVKISEATVFSAPAGKIVQLLSDHRENARLGVAIANDTDRAVAYVLVVGDIDGKVIGSTTLTIPARSSIARFADDIFNGLPGNHVGQIIITSTDSSDVYAIGLRFTGNTFTTIPVTVRPATLATTASPPTLTSITPTSGSAGTTVNVTLTGTNFASGGTTLQVSGFGITVGSVQVNGPTSLTAIFTISASATAAGRTVTVTTSAGTSNGVTFNVSASSTSFNEFQARRLIGTWRFMYTIISGFTNTYRLNDGRPSTTTAGEWVILGTDEVGDLVIAGWSTSLNQFTLLDTGTIIDRFFTFDFTGSNTVSGCYYQISPAGSSNLSRCYPMTGVRTSASAVMTDDMTSISTSVDLEKLSKVEAEQVQSNATTLPDQNVIQILELLQEKRKLANALKR